jgi:hypothetical protein
MAASYAVANSDSRGDFRLASASATTDQTGRFAKRATRSVVAPLTRCKGESPVLGTENDKIDRGPFRNLAAPALRRRRGRRLRILAALADARFRRDEPDGDADVLKGVMPTTGRECRSSRRLLSRDEAVCHRKNLRSCEHLRDRFLSRAKRDAWKK